MIASDHIPMSAAEELKIEREYCRFVRKLDRLVSNLEAMGENEMGIFRTSFCSQFHGATETLRNLTRTLQQDVYWPDEVTK